MRRIMIIHACSVRTYHITKINKTRFVTSSPFFAVAGLHRVRQVSGRRVARAQPGAVHRPRAPPGGEPARRAVARRRRVRAQVCPVRAAVAVRVRAVREGTAGGGAPRCASHHRPDEPLRWGPHDAADADAARTRALCLAADALGFGTHRRVCVCVCVCGIR